MLAFRFIKSDPSLYIMRYRNGAVVQEGVGLSFLYFAPTSTLVMVPVNTVDTPFAFNEVTADFQTVSVQGQVNFRIADPKKLAALLNYAVDSRGQYMSSDPDKLAERVINGTQSVFRKLIQGQNLKEVLASADKLSDAADEQLRKSPLAAQHGLEILGLSIIALRPNPDTAKALEAAAREELLRKADEAIYARRNAAVEQERHIKESELQTEIAVEEKKRQVRETQMRAAIALEEQRSSLMDKKTANEKKEADSRAYSMEKTLAPLKQLDWRTAVALRGGGDGSRIMIAEAFERLAANAQKIGQLNISPELLSSLIKPAAGQENVRD